MTLRVPKMFNLRIDPFERADVTSNTYWDWFLDNAYLVLAAQAVMAQFLQTFEEFPPRQKAASFTIDQAVAEARSRPHVGPLSDGEAVLPSWNDGPTKAAIVAFVERVTREGSARLRAAGRAHRGLRQRRHAVVRRSRCRSSWCSSCSASRRWPRRIPTCAQRQPWKAAYEKDYAWLGDVITKHYAATTAT